MDAADEAFAEIERAVPGVSPPELISEHVARYRFAARLVEDRLVLDIGSGAGYGAQILAESGAREVVALDVALEAALLLTREYASPRVGPVVGDGLHLPLPDGSIDCVVAFEVIEHVPSADALVGEAQRVLRPDGVFILSTPNRLTYNEHRQRGGNPYHSREFSGDELERILSDRFGEVTLYHQVFMEGVLIHVPGTDAPEADHGVFSDSADAVAEAMKARSEPDYFVAVCRREARASLIRRVRLGWHRRSNRRADLPGGFFYPSATDFLRRLRVELRNRRADLDEKRTWALRLDEELQLRKAEIVRLQEDLERKASWALDLEQEMKEVRERVLESQTRHVAKDQMLQRLVAEREQREETVRQLRAELERVQAPGRAVPGTDSGPDS